MPKKVAFLFAFLCCFMACDAVTAEFVGIKIFSLEKTVGFKPLALSLFGQTNLSLNMTTGKLMWPFVFVVTDIINEYYGKKGVRFATYVTVGLIGYTFFMVYAAIKVPPADVWLTINPEIEPSISVAYNKIFGQGINVIIGSITAFLISQWLDMSIFHYFRLKMGDKLGKRALISTLISQFVDSFLVSFIAFYLLGNWSLSLLFALVFVGYAYKCIVAVLATPLLYLVHNGIERYLGEEAAAQLKRSARDGY